VKRLDLKDKQYICCPIAKGIINEVKIHLFLFIFLLCFTI